MRREALAERRVDPPTVPAILGDADTRNFSHCSLAEGPLDTQVGVPLDAGALSILPSDDDLQACESQSKRPRLAGDMWEGF